MPVTGDPIQAVVDAMKTALLADGTLTGMVGATGVTGYVSAAARPPFPYLLLGRRHHTGDAGAMQKEGGHVSIQVDGWSDHKGPSEMHAIVSRCYVVLERTNLTIAGFTLVQNSLHREFADVFDEPDEDMPERVLFHGVQQWTCEIHES